MSGGFLRGSEGRLWFGCGMRLCGRSELGDSCQLVGVDAGRVFHHSEPVCLVVAPLDGEVNACNVEVIPSLKRRMDSSTAVIRLASDDWRHEQWRRTAGTGRQELRREVSAVGAGSRSRCTGWQVPLLWVVGELGSACVVAGATAPGGRSLSAERQKPWFGAAGAIDPAARAGRGAERQVTLLQSPALGGSRCSW